MFRKAISVESMESTNVEWYGFDLDGTLAYFDVWRGIHHIGKPIPIMIAKVKKLLAEGKTVKIFTARVDGGEVALMAGNSDGREVRDVARVKAYIEQWSQEHIGVILPITNQKDYGTVEIYDDRAIQIVQNTGLTVLEHQEQQKYIVFNANGTQLDDSKRNMEEYVLVKASSLIAVRDALVNENIHEAFHQLYYATEAKDPYNQWGEWEKKACT